MSSEQERTSSGGLDKSIASEGISKALHDSIEALKTREQRASVLAFVQKVCITDTSMVSMMQKMATEAVDEKKTATAWRKIALVATAIVCVLSAAMLGMTVMAIELTKDISTSGAVLTNAATGARGAATHSGATERRPKEGPRPKRSESRPWERSRVLLLLPLPRGSP